VDTRVDLAGETQPTAAPALFMRGEAALRSGEGEDGGGLQWEYHEP